MGATAALVAGCGGGGDDTEPDRKRPSAELTATVQRDDAYVGDTANRVLGRLLVGGRPARGNVRIEADPWPFADDGFEELRTVRTRRSGRWSTPVHPRRNTRYRAVAEGAEPTRPETVHVWPAQIVDARRQGFDVLIKYTVVASPGVPLRRRARAFVYSSSRGETAYRRVARGRLERRGRRLVLSMTYQPGREAGRAYACYAQRPSPALGRGRLDDRFCGSPRLVRSGRF